MGWFARARSVFRLARVAIRVAQMTVTVLRVAQQIRAGSSLLLLAVSLLG